MKAPFCKSNYVRNEHIMIGANMREQYEEAITLLTDVVNDYREDVDGECKEIMEALELVSKLAERYRAIKEKIDYSEAGDGMTWATLDWCVDVHSLSPLDLDEAIDQILLTK